MKKKPTKKLTGLLILLFFITASFGQTDSIKQKKRDEAGKELKQWFNSGDIIVDCFDEDAKFTPFTDAQGQKTGYICHKVKINNVIKGNVKVGYINIHTPGAHIPGQDVDLEYPGGGKGKAIYPTVRYLLVLKNSDVTSEGYIAENKGVFLVASAVKIVTTQNEKPLFQMVQDYCGVDMGMPKTGSEEKIQKKSLISTGANNITNEQRENNYKKYLENLKLRITKTKANKTEDCSTCCELFISEYLDDNNNDKAIEVFNPTNAVKSLSGYSIYLYHSGSFTHTTISLTGTIAPYSAYVVSNPLASAPLLAKTSQV